MIKFSRFLLVMIAVISMSPSISLAAAAGAPEDMHPLVAASPARRALLADPLYKLFQENKGKPSAYPRDMDPAAVQAAVDALPMAELNDLWAVHSLLGQCYGFDAAQKQTVGEYVAAKVMGLKDHADQNMRSMAMYCWAPSKWHALQAGQRDTAIEVLEEAMNAGISDYLKVKLAGHWYGASRNFQEDLESEYPKLELGEHMLGYDKLNTIISDLFRPHFLWARAHKTLYGSRYDDIDEKAKVRRETVAGSESDPYYHAKVQMLEAYARSQDGESPYNNSWIKGNNERIKYLDALYPTDESIAKLPVELKLELFQCYASIYSGWSSDMLVEDVVAYAEGSIKYARAIRDLGDRIPVRARCSATGDLVKALVNRNPAEAIALFDEMEDLRRAHKLALSLYDTFALIKLFIHGEDGVRNLPRARAIIAEYEKDVSKWDRPAVYVLMMEAYASPEGFNEDELLRATARLAELASKDPHLYIPTINDRTAYFTAYLQKLADDGKADTVFKVLNILIADLKDPSSYWRSDMARLVHKFLQSNPGVGPAEDRQRLLAFIEDALVQLPIEQRFTAVKERLEYLAEQGQWDAAKALYRKLLGDFRYAGVKESADYFVGYVQKLADDGKAEAALKVLDVLNTDLDPANEWGRAVLELEDQFLRNNPGAGTAEERQRLWAFIEGFVMTLNASQHFPALKGRLEYLAENNQWDAAKVLYGKLLNGLEYTGTKDNADYFAGYVQKLVVDGKADTALKVLDVLNTGLKPADAWGRAVLELEDQFLRNNPGVGTAEDRQRVLVFIEGALTHLPMEKRFLAMLERLIYLERKDTPDDWAAARALWERLLDNAVFSDTRPEWEVFGVAAIDFFRSYSPYYAMVEVPAAVEVRLARLRASIVAAGGMDTSE